MFARLFRQKDKNVEYDDLVQNFYETALKQTLKKNFYTKYGVPDSFDGRFDLLLLHLFIILRQLQAHENYEEISQALFDCIFKNMDQTLREMGIGDMGIPKHMRRMMQAFNGRMHAYQMAIDPESLKDKDIEGLKQTTLDDALRRNVYGTLKDEDINSEALECLKQYLNKNIDNQNSEGMNELLKGQVVFHDI